MDKQMRGSDQRRNCACVEIPAVQLSLIALKLKAAAQRNLGQGLQLLTEQVLQVQEAEGQPSTLHPHHSGMLSSPDCRGPSYMHASCAGRACLPAQPNDASTLRVAARPEH